MTLLEFYREATDIKESAHFSDILQARDLITDAIRDAHKKHDYFDFLKYLRKKHGEQYSTEVHRSASRLVRATP